MPSSPSAGSSPRASKKCSIGSVGSTYPRFETQGHTHTRHLSSGYGTVLRYADLCDGIRRHQESSVKDLRGGIKKDPLGVSIQLDRDRSPYQDHLLVYDNRC